MGPASPAQDIQFGAGAHLYDYGWLVTQGKMVYGLNETFELGGAFTYIFEDLVDFETEEISITKDLIWVEDFNYYHSLE
jgi:hypothetical protein